MTTYLARRKLLLGLAVSPAFARYAKASVANASQIVLGANGDDDDDRSALADYDALYFGDPATRGPSLPFEIPAHAGDVIYGIDVSHHNGDVHWDALARNGVSFAYIKASQSDRALDRQFEKNWADANRAGLAVGAYHFLTAGVPGADQANYFLSRLQAVGGLTAGKHLHPAVDIEWDEYGKDFTRTELARDADNRPQYKDYWQDVDASAIVTQLRAFVDGVSEGLRPLVVRPMIYTINSWWRHNIPRPRDYFPTLQGVPFWVCDVRQRSNTAGAPEYPDGVAFKIWQFSSDSIVKDGPTNHGPFDCNKLHDVSLSDLMVSNTA